MRDIANEAYIRTRVGSIGFINPDGEKGETVDEFQIAVATANVMASDGLIEIMLSHRENKTGKRLVDSIQFRRIK